jgi:hypothetical protein
MNDKLQEAINALRAAGDERGAKAVEELRGELARTMEQYHAGQRASYESGRAASPDLLAELHECKAALEALLERDPDLMSRVCGSTTLGNRLVHVRAAIAAAHPAA